MLPFMTWDLELPSSTHYSISDVKTLTVVLVSDGYHGESFRPVLSCVHRVCCPECERSLTGHGTSEHMPLVMTVTVCCLARCHQSQPGTSTGTLATASLSISLHHLLMTIDTEPYFLIWIPSGIWNQTLSYLIHLH